MQHFNPKLERVSTLTAPMIAKNALKMYGSVMTQDNSERTTYSVTFCSPHYMKNLNQNVSLFKMPATFMSRVSSCG